MRAGGGESRNLLLEQRRELRVVTLASKVGVIRESISFPCSARLYLGSAKSGSKRDSDSVTLRPPDQK